MIILFMDLTAEERSKLLRIYELYGKLMCLIALEFLQDMDLADDCVQDSFEKIAKYLDSIGEVESKSTKTYVRKVVESVAINMLKRESVIEMCEDDKFELLADQESAKRHDRPFDDEYKQKTALDDIMRNLTDEEKILIWHVYKGFSYKEIGQKLGISELTCRKRMERLRRKLKRFNRHISLKEV